MPDLAAFRNGAPYAAAGPYDPDASALAKPFLSPSPHTTLQTQVVDSSLYLSLTLFQPLL